MVTGRYPKDLSFLGRFINFAFIFIDKKHVYMLKSRDRSNMASLDFTVVSVQTQIHEKPLLILTRQSQVRAAPVTVIPASL